jgi:omega-6 fatty acid desaturase (delta-12 desaturase)
VWNNLDRRDTGVDIYSTCLTVDEFRSMGRLQRWWYRGTRNPIFANLILPPFVFLVLYRLPFDMPKTWRRERLGVYLSNLMLGGLAVGLAFAVGYDRVAEIQLPIVVLASIAGVWLFTVQHRSDRTVWRRSDTWNSLSASLDGATYLKLPAPLQWITGNIGLHHVHHLDPKIPNYRLQECHNAIAELHDVPVLSLSTAMRSMSYVLWDERQQQLVTYRKARRMHDFGRP